MPVVADTADSRLQLVLGWIAVTMSAMLGSFFGMFAGGEDVYDGWAAFLAHLTQMLALVLLALVSVRWPRAGGSVMVLAISPRRSARKRRYAP
ncbi:MAG: hypothetical protein Q8R28_18640 [Dehalococcoidia bacterium]|nr:hypothetical protein [Dehalococcoidia bacterium]